MMLAVVKANAAKTTNVSNWNVMKKNPAKTGKFVQKTNVKAAPKMPIAAPQKPAQKVPVKMPNVPTKNLVPMAKCVKTSAVQPV